MSVVKRRYYFWLIKAYFKRWNKTILSSLGIGVGIFFLIFFVFNFYFLPLIQKKVTRIGYYGTYTASQIPTDIMSEISYGLTQVASDGSVTGAAAYKWEIKNDGKDYIFYIKKGQYFDEDEELNAHNINLSFPDVRQKVIDDYTIQFSLAQAYSPFLVTASKPILTEDFKGLGKYKVKKADLNAGFIRSLTLQDKEDSESKKVLSFYPTEHALKLAYALGDVDQISNVRNSMVKDRELADWINTKTDKTTDYNTLLTLFYNNSDSALSNKNLRQALTYALPESFKGGERAYSSIPPESVYFAEGPNYGISDTEIAKSLVEDNDDIANTTFEITTPEEYEELAKEVISAWERIGVKAKIKIVSGLLPRNFQMLIYPVSLPKDPDQYTLWHSNGASNIINYTKNARIDKLLEDGRSTEDFETRSAIYADFQKYIADDAPASFLYFPYVYKISRK